MKCPECKNYVAALWPPDGLCSACTQSMGSSDEPEKKRPSPGATLVQEIIQKATSKERGRPARRHGTNGPKRGRPKKTDPKKELVPRDDFVAVKSPRHYALIDPKTEHVAKNGADEELPEKDIVLNPNAAQWRILRKLLVRGFHGATIEDVCMRLLDCGLEKSVRLID